MRTRDRALGDISGGHREYSEIGGGPNPIALNAMAAMQKYNIPPPTIATSYKYEFTTKPSSSDTSSSSNSGSGSESSGAFWDALTTAFTSAGQILGGSKQTESSPSVTKATVIPMAQLSKPGNDTATLIVVGVVGVLAIGALGYFALR